MGKYIEDKPRSQGRCHPPIRVSYFNREEGTMSWTFNYWGEGVCFQSKTRFEVGATVLIRACRREMGCVCNTPQPPTNTLGVVKWCREVPGAVPPVYEVNVRYFLPES